MSSLGALRLGSLPTVKRQQLLAEFAALKQACPQGVFVSLTPGDPTLWSGVIFVRKGPYAPAILRFQISFPDTYPSLPPLVTFSTDMFHPLIAPLTTYMYSTDVVGDGATASARDDERLPPGGFSLRHGFPGWFGRGSRAREEAAAERRRVASGGGDGGLAGVGEQRGVMTPPRAASAVVTATGATPGSVASASSASPSSSSSSSAAAAAAPGYVQTGRREVSTYDVLRYIRGTFDDADVLDAVPLEAAGNPGAWHAWRTHRRSVTAAAGAAGGKPLPVQKGEEVGVAASAGSAAPAAAAAAAAMATRRPGEWNWEGVWEERVKRGIAASLSEGVLYGAGAADEVINFLSMEDAEVEGTKANLLRTLGAAA